MQRFLSTISLKVGSFLTNTVIRLLGSLLTTLQRIKLTTTAFLKRDGVVYWMQGWREVLILDLTTTYLSLSCIWKSWLFISLKKSFVRCLKVSKLQAHNIKNGFVVEFNSQLSSNQGSSIEQKWNFIKKVFLTACENVLGFYPAKKKHWMSETTWDLIEHRRSAKRTRDEAKTRAFKNFAELEYNQLNNKLN